MVVTADHSRLITGSTDGEIRVWAIVDADSAGPAQLEAAQAAEGVPVVFVPLGSVARQSRERVVTLAIGCGGRLLACHAADKAVEFFRFRTEAEIAKRIKRRSKREREKTAEGDGGGAAADDDDTSSTAAVRTLDDELHSFGVLRCSTKIKALCFDPSGDGSDGAAGGAVEADRPGTVALALSNNVLEVHALDAGQKSLATERLADVSFSGLRTPLRAVAMDENDALVLTTSNKGAKVWDRGSRRCIRTLQSGYARAARPTLPRPLCAFSLVVSFLAGGTTDCARCFSCSHMAGAAVCRCGHASE
jgi:U3 small nucleolar RNA-associated protein 12